MITFQQLGHLGRLGNQMFQYAALVGVAHARRVAWGLNFANEESAKTYRMRTRFLRRSYKVQERLELRQVFTISAQAAGRQQREYREPHFHFDPAFFAIEDGTDIWGYFQSPKYFAHCAELIRREFTFKQPIRDAAEAILAPLSDRTVVGLHVRRGDYVAGISRGHYADPGATGYYQRAMEHFAGDCRFLCFSDDHAWCRKHLPSRLVFVDGGSPYVDLCLLSLCHHNIMGNSTFSWWAAWLNTHADKTVICPQAWFGPGRSQHSIQDLYCPEWLRLY